eukprot:7627146-Ditylum_brightwellii.AAC.1
MGYMKGKVVSGLDYLLFLKYVHWKQEQSSNHRVLTIHQHVQSQNPESAQEAMHSSPPTSARATSKVNMDNDGAYIATAIKNNNAIA